MTTTRATAMTTLAAYIPTNSADLNSAMIDLDCETTNDLAAIIFDDARDELTDDALALRDSLIRILNERLTLIRNYR